MNIILSLLTNLMWLLTLRENLDRKSSSGTMLRVHTQKGHLFPNRVPLAVGTRAVISIQIMLVHGEWRRKTFLLCCSETYLSHLWHNSKHLIYTHSRLGLGRVTLYSSHAAFTLHPYSFPLFSSILILPHCPASPSFDERADQRGKRCASSWIERFLSTPEIEIIVIIIIIWHARLCWMPFIWLL